jgi:adenylyltransferase/sulfurtransferase
MPSLARYRGHLNLPEVGLEGQRRLSEASVLCIGTGGLGSPAALYLAAAGIGRLGLVDADEVDESNLHRQVLFGTADVGRSKVEVARRTLEALNPTISIVTHDTRLGPDNTAEILAGYDVVVDGTDNFPTRYLINEHCVQLGKPDVWASIYRFEGQVSVFDSRRGPCYRCLFREEPTDDLAPSCSDAGVLGVLPGILGTMQAAEAIKLILGVGEPLIGRLLVFDALGMRWDELAIGKDPSCPTCSGSVATPPTTARPAAREVRAIAPADLRRRLDSGDRLTLVDCREPHEWEAFHLDASRLIPLAQLPARHSEIEPHGSVVVLCQRGPRSVQAARFLTGAGFPDVAYLDGGLHAWMREIPIV